MKNKKNKKAVSIMIGYVLLITFAVVMGAIVYQWIKTYVPQDSLSCPPETSLFVKSYSYDCTTKELDLTLVNNGKFDIGGYYIYATNTSTQALATIDMSKFWSGDPNRKVGSIIRFYPIQTGTNIEAGGESLSHIFNLDVPAFAGQQVYSIEMTPVRWQTIKKKEKIITCGQAKLKEIISCDV